MKVLRIDEPSSTVESAIKSNDYARLAEVVRAELLVAGMSGEVGVLIEVDQNERGCSSYSEVN